MSTIYDTEDMLISIKDLLVNKLNDEITAVNTEKGSSLEAIPSDHIILQAPSDNMLNFSSPFILYGLVADPKVKAAQVENYIEEATFHIEISCENINEIMDEELFFNLLRYNKALKNLFMKNSDLFKSYAKVFMESLTPTEFKYEGKTFLSVGVSIKASITAR